MERLQWTKALVEETCVGCGVSTRRGEWILEDEDEGMVWCESCGRRDGPEVFDQDINE